MVPWLVAAAALVAAAILATRERAPMAEARLLQLDVQLADDLQLGSLLGHTIALSPDGTRLVFVALAGSEPALYLRTLDQPTITLLPDTPRAEQPFFSPDGREVGFFTGSELRRVSLAGGASNLIVDGRRLARRELGRGRDDRVLRLAERRADAGERERRYADAAHDARSSQGRALAPLAFVPAGRPPAALQRQRPRTSRSTTPASSSSTSRAAAVARWT